MTNDKEELASIKRTKCRLD